MKAGGVYDVAVIENSNIAALTTLGLRREINYQNISNFRNSAPDIFNTSIFFSPPEMIKESDWYLPLSPAGEKLYAEI